VKWAKTIFWMVVFLCVILFSMENKDEVILRFGFYPLQNYLWEVPKIPLFLVILCSIFAGALIGGLGDLYRHFQLKKILRQNQRMIERLEKEIQSLNRLRFEKSPSLKEDYEVR
jgi:uncharacterized integral membrane protein